MVDIKSREDLERWLAGRSQDEAVAIAARAAMRATPALVRLFQTDRVENPRAHLSPLLHATIISGVARKWPTPEMNSAADSVHSENSFRSAADSARSAHSAAFFAADSVHSENSFRSAADSAHSAARSAADSAHSAFSAGFSAGFSGRSTHSAADSAVYSAVSDDCERLADGASPEALLNSPLWPSGPPDGLRGDWERLDAIFAEDPAFAFWRRWYQGALDGDPLNWELQRDVALIPADIWEAGPDRVAGEIARIEASHATKPIDPQAVSAQASRLLVDPGLAEVTAEGLARQIEDWITAYLREAEANALPDELSPLESLPAILRRMSSIAASEGSMDRIAELETTIEQMALEIEALRARLSAASDAPKESVFWTSFQRKVGESLGDWKFWGAMASGAYFLLGGSLAPGALGEIVGLVRSAAAGSAPK